MSSESPARKCGKFDHEAIMEEDSGTNNLLQTLMMESSSFTKTRGFHSHNYQDSDIFSVRDRADEGKLPKTLDLTQKRSNVPMSRKLSAKKKVDRETLDLDALRKTGVTPQQLFDDSGKVVDIGSTGYLKPYNLMTKTPPKTQLNTHSPSKSLATNGFLKENGFSLGNHQKDNSFISTIGSAEPVKFGNVTRLSRKTEVIVNNHRNLNHYVPLAKNGVPKFYKFFPDRPPELDAAEKSLYTAVSKAQPPFLILKNPAASVAGGKLLPVDPINSTTTTSNVSKFLPSSTSPEQAAIVGMGLMTSQKLCDFKSSSALVADKLISNCS
ncbi:uncharacterized protein LOC134840053 isoform X2 [Symsagittifera roscoffensis]|uniref:uncharacterized protein LOC134840053 isoform X2 n=1 Tax=Symsagittifera roscoffensis TaxID=84072 RepID=UPI00307BD8EB